MAAGVHRGGDDIEPTDVEREEIGLRGLIDAVKVLEGDSRPGDHGTANA
ncbi:hypothetical protein AB0M44_49490 [Streptosporangium subroseum]